MTSKNSNNNEKSSQSDDLMEISEIQSEDISCKKCKKSQNKSCFIVICKLCKICRDKNNAYKKNKSKPSTNKEENKKESLPNEFQEIITGFTRVLIFIMEFHHIIFETI